MIDTAPTEAPEEVAETPARRRGRLRRALSFTEISGVYILIALIIAFSLWIPDLFPTSATLQAIGQTQAITTIIALGLIFPLATHRFDVSVPWALGLTAIVSAEMAVSGAGVPAILLVALAIALAVGLINGFLVAVIGMNSVIATLAMGSVLQAVVLAVSGNQQTLGLPESFGQLGQSSPLGIPIAVIYLVVIAVVLWYVFEHTAFGRQLHSIGRGPEAARLAGLPVARYLMIAMLLSALTASFAGVVLSAQIAAGVPDIGPSYLLPAFAAAFLGETQIKRGRANVWGTVLAAYLLGTGTTGLQLAGAPFWVPYLFNGLALIFAVGLSLVEGRLQLRRDAKRRVAARRRASAVPAPETEAP